MKKKEDFIDLSGKRIHFVEWIPEVKPVAILQISHGMMEYIERYEEFAHFLNERGILVAGNDHRGHGKTSESLDELGVIEKSDTFERMVEDLACVTRRLRNDYPGLPVILFGHSFGSFLAQAYISIYDGYVDGVILSGTSGSLGFKVYFGLVLSWILKLILGGAHRSRFLNFLVFGPYNLHFRPNRTKIDWLSSDDTEVDRYIDDEYCGKICSLEFFYQLFRCLGYIHRRSTISSLRKELPVMIIAGSDDPVGGFLKTIRWLVSSYIDIGMKSLCVRIYEGNRHECLHEKNRNVVFNDIFAWISHLILFRDN